MLFLIKQQLCVGRSAEGSQNKAHVTINDHINQILQYIITMQQCILNNIIIISFVIKLLSLSDLLNLIKVHYYVKYWISWKKIRLSVI